MSQPLSDDKWDRQGRAEILRKFATRIEEWERPVTPDSVIPSTLRDIADTLDEQHYADAEHEHLGCSVVKTGIYAPKSIPSSIASTSAAAGLAEEIEGHCQQRQSAGLGLLGRSSMGGREFTIDEQNMVVAALRAFVPSATLSSPRWTDTAEAAFEKWWQNWRQQNLYPNTQRMRDAARAVYESLTSGSIDTMVEQLREQGHLRDTDGPASNDIGHT